MIEEAGTSLQSIYRRSLITRYTACLLEGMSLGIFLGGLSFIFWSQEHILIPLAIFFVSLAAVFYWRAPYSFSLPNLCSLLDARYPQLDYSCHLILKELPPGLLARLQAVKLAGLLKDIENREAGKPVLDRMLPAVALFVLAVSVVLVLPAAKKLHWFQGVPSTLSMAGHAGSLKLPTKVFGIRIIKVKMEVYPPAYCRLHSFTTTGFSTSVPAGSKVHWTLETNQPAAVSLQFSSQVRGFNAAKDAAMSQTHRFSATLDSSCFYQIVLGRKVSEPYMIAVRPDRPPAIKIEKPKAITELSFGESLKIMVSGSANDDYGLQSGTIQTTLVKGNGEAVKFKRATLALGSSFLGRPRTVHFARQVDLAKQGLEPGDELYFYVEVSDDLDQRSRSDIYHVKLTDTASYGAMGKLSFGLNAMPEYFRSERQIIIETEALLARVKKMPAGVFKEKSAGLGLDQKVLRLRYGKFLGEESESAIGSEPGSANAEAQAGDFGNAAKVLDEYTDKHDTSEDNSFFDSGTKKELLAILSQMWKAELELRSILPRAALPFEYKALRLLKVFQEKSRAYVPNSVYIPSPIDIPKKRLSGDLKQVFPSSFIDAGLTRESFSAVKTTLAFIDSLRLNRAGRSRYFPSAVVQGSLGYVDHLLLTKAGSDPGRWLKPWHTLHQIMLNCQMLRTETKSVLNPREDDLRTLEKALYLMAGARAVVLEPGSERAFGGSDLAHRYYRFLNSK